MCPTAAKRLSACSSVVKSGAKIVAPTSAHCRTECVDVSADADGSTDTAADDDPDDDTDVKEVAGGDCWGASGGDAGICPTLPASAHFAEALALTRACAHIRSLTNALRMSRPNPTLKHNSEDDNGDDCDDDASDASLHAMSICNMSGRVPSSDMLCSMANP